MRLAIKLGVSCAANDGLAQSSIAELGNSGNIGRIGIGGGNDLEQAHVARRIEEVRAEEVRLQLRRQTGCDRRRWAARWYW